MFGFEKGINEELTPQEKQLVKQNDTQMLLIEICAVTLILIFSVFYM